MILLEVGISGNMYNEPGLMIWLEVGISGNMYVNQG
jgi:hypothetical protein